MIFRSYPRFIFNAAGERVVARLRVRLFRAIVTQEIAMFDRRKTGGRLPDGWWGRLGIGNARRRARRGAPSSSFPSSPHPFLISPPRGAVRTPTVPPPGAASRQAS